MAYEGKFQAAFLIVAACVSVPREPTQYELADAQCVEANRVAGELLKSADFARCEKAADCGEVSPSLAGHCGTFVNVSTFDDHRATFEKVDSSCSINVQILPECVSQVPSCVQSKCEGAPVSIIVDECDEAETALASAVAAQNTCEKNEDCTMLEVKGVLTPASVTTSGKDRQLACGKSQRLSASDTTLYDVSCVEKRCQGQAPPTLATTGVRHPVIEEACLRFVFRKQLMKYGREAYHGEMSIKTVVSKTGRANKFSFIGPGTPKAERQVEIATGLRDCLFEPASRNGEPFAVTYVMNFNLLNRP